MPLGDLGEILMRSWKHLKAADGEVPAEQAVLRPSHPGVIITIAREHGPAGKRVG